MLPDCSILHTRAKIDIQPLFRVLMMDSVNEEVAAVVVVGEETITTLSIMTTNNGKNCKLPARQMLG
jgi:hypothetical protein